jgi:radical SAM enzyme (TIGR01210 family)
VLAEREPAADGSIADIAAVFLTGRECPWRCVMCDLWQHTISADTPPGAIAFQVRSARQGVMADTLKLYNAGSFFDPRAVPDRDYDEIAGELSGLSRVIVESHPSLVGPRTRRLLDALGRSANGGPVPALEVAMGLESVHPDALARLNKRMTVDDFSRAAERLAAMGVALRVFLLVSPPFVPRAEQDAWLLRSVDAAVAAGASAISLIATRPGNGALDALAADGLFEAPRIADLERSFALGLDAAKPRGVRMFADVWELGRLTDCPACLADRHARLSAINLEQVHRPAVECATCGAGFDRR